MKAFLRVLRLKGGSGSGHHGHSGRLGKRGGSLPGSGGGAGGGDVKRPSWPPFVGWDESTWGGRGKPKGWNVGQEKNIFRLSNDGARRSQVIQDNGWYFTRDRKIKGIFREIQRVKKSSFGEALESGNEWVED